MAIVQRVAASQMASAVVARRTRFTMGIVTMRRRLLRRMILATKIMAITLVFLAILTTVGATVLSRIRVLSRRMGGTIRIIRMRRQRRQALLRQVLHQLRHGAQRNGAVLAGIPIRKLLLPLLQ